MNRAPVAVGAAPTTREVGRDGTARIVGTFPFAVDREVAETAHACAARSSVVHGRIRDVDVSAAAEVPGVLAVLVGRDVQRQLGARMYHGENRQDQPVLAVDRVRYVGEPLALVVAEERSIAEAAARLVRSDIEELPWVTDHDVAAGPEAPQLHDDWPENACGSWRLVHGDARTAMARAAHVHTATYRSPSANHAALEPHVATAAWPDDGSLEVWSGTQAPYDLRKRLSTIFGLPPERVRVRCDNIGGGFGSKLDLRLEALVAVGARAVGRPVRMELRRDEVFVTAAKHAATVTVTTGADQDGNLVARIVDVVYNAGAYALSTPRSIRSGMIRSPGPYRTPHVLVRACGRYTNTVPTGPFRGAMTGQVCWAHESALDELADELGMDPVELRDRNILRDGDVYATGEAMRDMHYRALLRAVADGIGWHEPPDPCRKGWVRGKGVAVVLKSTRTPSRSEAIVSIDRSGRVTIRTSSIEMGQGAHRSMAELAAKALGISPLDVAVSVVDTAWTPFDTVTSSSRATLSMGSAVERAALDLRRRIDRLVVAECGPIEGPLPHANSRVGADLPGTKSFSYEEVVALTGRDELSGYGTYVSPPGVGRLDPETSQGLHTVSWHQGAVGVEVEVDTATGRVHVLRAHGAVFAGRVVDEARVRKQVEGGMIFGLGQALMEEVVYDSGELANGNLSDYQIPSMLDAPLRIGSTIVADPAPAAAPHGVGENTVPPMAPAIGNAIFRATGARVRELPLTAERVLRAIRNLPGGQR